jgi:hypothetical protein
MPNAARLAGSAGFVSSEGVGHDSITAIAIA